MPELPDLEVVKEFLNLHVQGKEVVRAEVLRPTVLRPLAAADFAADVVGRRFGMVARRGKQLLLPLEPERLLVINFMLTGRLQYCMPGTRVLARTFFLLATKEAEVRYLDQQQMGIVYYVRPDQLGQVPRLEEVGPDALESNPTFEQFAQWLRPFRGEIKGVLTRGAFLSGIGNGYSDEILFAAGISPFRRCKELAQEELHRLHQAVPQVLSEAIEVLRQRVPPNIHVEVRDFLKVHRKGGQPCPRCGHAISEITANQRVTSFCRRCQPGSLIRN